MDKYLSLTKEGIDTYLQTLSDINWFNIQPNDKKVIAERLNEQKQNKDFVFSLYNLWFDAEGFEDHKLYESLLDEILEIVQVPVLQKNVSYNEENNSVSISLTTQKATYDYKIILDDFGDWIDENFIDIFINEQILKGENIENKFLALPMCDQTIQFVFVPQSTYDAAVDKGIIPQELNYFITDMEG